MAGSRGENLGELRRSLRHSSGFHHCSHQFQKVLDGESVFLRCGERGELKTLAELLRFRNGDIESIAFEDGLVVDDCEFLVGREFKRNRPNETS